MVQGNHIEEIKLDPIREVMEINNLPLQIELHVKNQEQSHFHTPKKSGSATIRQLEKQLTMNWECHKVIRTGRWIRPDCIIIGCLQVNDDDGEENYAVQVITNENGRITSPSAKPVVRSFRDVFLDFRHDAVPLCSGPHLFSSYLDQQYVFLLCLYVYDRFSASGFN
ncbi:hypothetical protein HAX54_007951 [Datura stramonium]|uniref:DUF5641 domain-containing protein n=1 Tax=Datura stramonium TaxID=4076 RepID=A0ABS8WX04_DATST|nr:hypothetical protein [Datura stramonium]